MPSLDQFFHKHRNTVKTYRRIKMRSYLNADTLYTLIREDFDKVKDHRASNAKISLADTLMSGFAMFCLNDPSGKRSASYSRRSWPSQWRRSCIA